MMPGGSHRDWEAEKPRILKLSKKGWAPEAIAAGLMCDRSTLIRKLREWGIIRASVPKAAPPEPEPKPVAAPAPPAEPAAETHANAERNAECIRLRDQERLSAAQIGKRFGMTRNAVIGVWKRYDDANMSAEDLEARKARRMRDGVKDHELRQKRAETHDRISVPRPERIQTLPIPSGNTAIVPLPKCDREPAAAGAVPLLERTGCAWPYGTKETGIVFCNAPRCSVARPLGISERMAYCEEHWRRRNASRVTRVVA